jgi:hypothetical protein
MKKITSKAELKNAILLLEEKKAVQGKLLEEEFQATREGLKPANLVKNLFGRFSASTDFKVVITTAVLGLAVFYFAKKSISRSLRSPFKILLGSLIQTGVSSIISHHPGAIKSMGQVLLQRVFHKKEDKPKKIC